MIVCVFHTAGRLACFAGLLAGVDLVAWGACEATVWRDYRGDRLWRFPEAAAYYYVVNRMAAGADGAPNAYHPTAAASIS
jgi:hypothetical protein